MTKLCYFKLGLLFFAIVLPRINAQDVDLTFPDGFLIGAALSAHQHEGAWNISNKGINLWDHYTHKHPEIIDDNSNADVTSDFYHKYKEDIKLMKDIGLTHFRFSISWSRIFPSGLTSNPSKNGLRFYHNVLDELEKQDIIPFVTIYHWDHPIVLETFGGWKNEGMAYVFARYARFIFKEFGHRVKFFTTINEPNISCEIIYGTDHFGLKDSKSKSSKHLCIHNMLKAHALAYHIYNNEFRKKQKGQVGIVIHCTAFYGKDKSDEKSADLAHTFECGEILHPIYSETGDYPVIMKKRIAEKSILEKLCKSNLPAFTKEWVNYIRGTADYLGINYYTAQIVQPLPLSNQSTWPNDEGLIYSVDPQWPSAQTAWLKMKPEGLSKILRIVKEKYNNPPVYILENGSGDGNGIDDDFKIKYLYSHMKETLVAIKKDKCNVKAYTIWSFLDGFEWFSGYQATFGLVKVDFKDKDRHRTPKKSAVWLKSVIKTGKLKLPNQD